tara:strand:+ start:15515 stop:15889 length:375 start_codon:yes stop_codon:yes gene_type:complete
MSKLQELYNTFNQEEQNKFLEIKQQNPNMQDRQIVYQILNARRSQRSQNNKTNQFAMRASRPVVKSTWREVLKYCDLHRNPPEPIPAKEEEKMVGAVTTATPNIVRPRFGGKKDGEEEEEPTER